MLLLKRAQARDNGQDANSFAPIVKVLTQMSEKDKDMLRVKFDIAHFVATQQLSFTNYPVLCQLENKHGVDVGMAYCNQNTGKTFCHFIAESKRAELGGKIEKYIFFSILIDGSTDSANIDDELFLVTWSSTDGHGHIVCTNMSYHC